MSKPTRYTQETIREYLDKGLWQSETLSMVFDRNAREYPGDIAVEDSVSRVTWREAKKWIDRVAAGFIGAGMQRDDVLAVQLPNSVELYLLRAATEKAGILCLPVLRTMRRREMEYILNKTKAAGVVIPWKIGDFDYHDMIESLRPDVPSLKHIFFSGNEVPPGSISLNEVTRQPTEKKYPARLIEERRFKVTEVSLINLTTGTTGFPKFVEYPICARLVTGRAFMEAFKFTARDTLGALAPASGGPNMPVYYAAPQVPCRVAMLEKFTPEDAFKMIEKSRVTVPCVVPAQLALMVQHPSLKKYDLSSIRAWFSCGAPMAYSLGVEVEEKIGGIIMNAYGALDFGSCFIHDLDDPREIRFLTAGKPRVGTIAKIVDDDGKEVNRGEVGELTGCGPTCSSGYYGDPEATQEAWGKDGCYKTGDLARIDEQGNLVIVGRKKDMIIRGGQNIYPVEIENLLVQHPSVHSVAIVGYPDAVMGERACAFIIPKQGKSLTFEEMVSFLKEKEIAPYKLPERLELVEKFPMAGDGQKVDKKLLRQEILSRVKSN